MEKLIDWIDGHQVIETWCGVNDDAQDRWKAPKSKEITVGRE